MGYSIYLLFDKAVIISSIDITRQAAEKNESIMLALWDISCGKLYSR